MFSGILGVIVDMRGSKTLNCKYRMLLHVLCCRLLELLPVGLVTLARCCIPVVVMISCFFLRSVGPTAVSLCYSMCSWKSFCFKAPRLYSYNKFSSQSSNAKYQSEELNFPDCNKFSCQRSNVKTSRTKITIRLLWP